MALAAPQNGTDGLQTVVVSCIGRGDVRLSNMNALCAGTAALVGQSKGGKEERASLELRCTPFTPFAGFSEGRA